MHALLLNAEATARTACRQVCMGGSTEKCFFLHRGAELEAATGRGSRAEGRCRMACAFVPWKAKELMLFIVVPIAGAVCLGNLMALLPNLLLKVASKCGFSCKQQPHLMS